MIESREIMVRTGMARNQPQLQSGLALHKVDHRASVVRDEPTRQVR